MFFKYLDELRPSAREDLKNIVLPKLKNSIQHLAEREIEAVERAFQAEFDDFEKGWLASSMTAK